MAGTDDTDTTQNPNEADLARVARAQIPPKEAAEENPVVFLLDVDNTLLDNDGVKSDESARLQAVLGPALTEAFWREYEVVRHLTGMIDMPLTFERFDAQIPDPETRRQVRAAFMEYPFAERLFPATLDTVAYLGRIGLPVVLSDGDSVYQPLKVEKSGIGDAVGGRVVIVPHKEDHLDEVFARWPAPFYVMIDDKASILAALKRLHPDRFVCVQVLQGHYARATGKTAPPPDIVLHEIGEARGLSLDALRAHLHPRPY